MRFNGEFWEGTTANTSGSFGETLTVEKLRAVMRDLKRFAPKPDKFDLYPHDMGLDEDGKERMFELGREAFELVGQKYERRFVIVPRNRIETLAAQMRQAGIDVRVSPTYRDALTVRESDG